MPLTLFSPAFADGERIPVKYSRDGENMSPPLKWTGPPEGTRSFVLVIEDPDAPRGTFRHWGVFNIPADRDGFPESVETGPEKADLRVVVNDFGNSHYDGPQPPRDDPEHHYYFRLAALSVSDVNLAAAAGVAELWREAHKHMIEEASFMGTYQR
jgi:Raf kinase inhibitor-like YbhB/YbcL family protein